MAEARLQVRVTGMWGEGRGGPDRAGSVGTPGAGRARGPSTPMELVCLEHEERGWGDTE